MTYYVPDAMEKDPSKVIMSLQQVHEKTAANTDDITTTTADIATNTADIATNTANIATNTTNITTLQNTVGHGYFHVNRNGSNQTGATGNAYNKIQFSNEVVDSQNYFDNATNFRFQPTRAGWYFFHLNARASTSTSDSPQAAIAKNGSVVLNGSYMAATSSVTAYSTVSGLVQLNGSTDYVEGFVFLPTGITTISGTATDTYMFGYRVA